MKIRLHMRVRKNDSVSEKNFYYCQLNVFNLK